MRQGFEAARNKMQHLFMVGSVWLQTKSSNCFRRSAYTAFNHKYEPNTYLALYKGCVEWDCINARFFSYALNFTQLFQRTDSSRTSLKSNCADLSEPLKRVWFLSRVSTLKMLIWQPLRILASLTSEVFHEHPYYISSLKRFASRIEKHSFLIDIIFQKHSNSNVFLFLLSCE